METKLTLKYDREADILYINRCAPYADQESEELGDDVVARLNPQTNRQEKVGGVKFTIKDGIVYDAQKLLAEVAASVAAEKRTVTTTTAQP